MTVRSGPDWHVRGTHTPDVRDTAVVSPAGPAPSPPAAPERAVAPAEPPWVDPPFNVWQPTIDGNLTVFDDGTNQWGVITCRSLVAANINGQLMGLQFLTGAGPGPLPLTAPMISNAISAGAQGIFLDPTKVWDASGLVIKDVSNFVIESRMMGSIGWTGNIAYNTQGYIKTDTGSPADGIQIYSDGAAETQGIVFRNCVIVGGNSNSVVHLGGRQRRCAFPDSLIYNTNATQTTVAAGSNGVDVTTFAGAGTLNVASTTGFASAGNLVVATSTVMATLSYTGKTPTTFTGVTTLGGVGTLATGGTVGQAAFGLLLDTALSNFNTENSDFDHLSVAGGNVAVGIGINDQAQHANDCLWPGLTTAAGLAALVDVQGSNHTFLNYYDRSSPALCTVANHGGVLTFAQGESQNGNATAPHDLLSSTNATTVYISRTLTQVSATNTVVNSSGRFEAKARCRLTGGCAMSGTAYLDVSDPGGSLSSFSVTGSTGTVLASGQYTGGSGNAPNLAGFTGTVHTSQWV